MPNRARFYLHVFGCQMNVYDADRLRSALVNRGWVEAPEDTAEVIVFVTCSIREKAEQKVLSALGRHGRSWSRASRPLVAVIGCMAQRMGEELMRRFPWVRLVAGPRHLGLVPEALDDALRNGRRHLLLDVDAREVIDLNEIPIVRSNPYKAYVTIAHGCDNFCTYCIVPYVRGRFRSRRPEDVICEVERLVKSGALEVTLVGQNVNSYGRDLKGYSFPRLLEDVASVPGLVRLRFTTSHPRDFTDDLIEVMARVESICPSVNLPIQSGSDRILRLMNRGYTVAEYAAKVEMLRDALPQLGLTSDLIVGFPTESDEDFRASLRALETFRFDQVHTASYSPREGTPAARMAGQVSEETKRERLCAVNALQSEIALEINKGLVGKECEILLDGFAPKGEGLLQGRTATDKVVIVPGDATCLGKFALVKFVRAEHWCLHGEILSLHTCPMRERKVREGTG
ncbi:MAG TPA: tRNA (N6-isopentenyl adenosine(37)-C2)-methylthiotransferase MiaB [Thermosynergistes sp.]|nr:tRNA (N6-isopentenyl adenosine(37)-C2)-methylthiotransferase MiaB [Thermosynergistes sp.]